MLLDKGSLLLLGEFLPHSSNDLHRLSVGDTLSGDYFGNLLVAEEDVRGDRPSRLDA